MDKDKIYDASLDVDMEDRARIEPIRDNLEKITVNGVEIGKITGYNFHILIRDKEALSGHLTRDEVDLLFRLYSREGSNLSQRSVARYFNYALPDMKKVLRAFMLTKDSTPFAQHTLEEESLDQLVSITLQHKENDYLRKLEQDRTKITEGHLRELTKKYYDLQNQIINFQDFLSTVNFKVTPVQYIKPSHSTNDDTIIVYISDMHIGADVSNYSIYKNTFNLEVATSRLQDLTQHIINTCSFMHISNIVVCNLGDSLDGYDGETTRGGHQLPQNMNNKDQFKNFIQLMIGFFGDLSNSGLFNAIEYICVEGGNHDGDAGFMTNKALEACLGVLNPAIEVIIFEKFIDYFTVKNHAFILCHGKDAKDMFKNMPLVINDKVENQITEFVRYNKIESKHIHFIKGDLHQSATTYGKNVRYKSVASFFGSSEWIHKNFGNTLAAVDFDIVAGDNIFESRLMLNK